MTSSELLALCNVRRDETLWINAATGMLIATNDKQTGVLYLWIEKENAANCYEVPLELVAVLQGR